MRNKVSIIIPICNSEKYLSRCLDSILAQTYKDYEVICVVNGSTDNSLYICEEYAKLNEQFSFFETEKGVSHARNEGLKRVTGEWFTFIDSDDWVSNSFLEILVSNAIENNSSMSTCSFYRTNQYYLKDYSSNNIKIVDSLEAAIHNYICRCDNSMSGMVWNKLYKTSVFQNVFFDESININEDCMYTYEALLKSERICISDAKLYYWFIHKNSACHSKQDSLDFSSADVYIKLLKLVEKYGDQEVELTLKSQYVKSIIYILFNAKSKNENTSKALENLKDWINIVWDTLDWKLKIKYIWINLKMR